MLEKYEALPEWLRWIVFLPISAIAPVILTCIMTLFWTNYHETLLADIASPVIIWFLFLGMIYYTVPRGKLIWVKILIGIRVLFLVILVLLPIVAIVISLAKGEGNIFFEIYDDWSILKDIVTEVLILAASLMLLNYVKEDYALRFSETEPLD